MRTIKRVEHELHWSRRGGVWTPIRNREFDKARKLAFAGRREEALEEADRVDAEHHREGCPEADHSGCSGFTKFSILTVTKERAAIIDFETMLEAGGF